MGKSPLNFFVIEEQLEKIYRNNAFLPNLGNNMPP